MLYYPALKDVIKEVICGNEKNKGIIQEGQYKEYLLKYINDIVSAFTETENRNLRIIRSWIFLFRKYMKQQQSIIPIVNIMKKF